MDIIDSLGMYGFVVLSGIHENHEKVSPHVYMMIHHSNTRFHWLKCPLSGKGITASPCLEVHTSNVNSNAISNTNIKINLNDSKRRN